MASQYEQPTVEDYFSDDSTESDISIGGLPGSMHILHSSDASLGVGKATQPRHSNVDPRCDSGYSTFTGATTTSIGPSSNSIAQEPLQIFPPSPVPQRIESDDETFSTDHSLSTDEETPHHLAHRLAPKQHRVPIRSSKTTVHTMPSRMSTYEPPTHRRLSGKPALRENAAQNFKNTKRGFDEVYSDQSYRAARRRSRVPSEAESSRSRGSDKQSYSDGNGEIRLKVDASAPISLFLNGDLEGRRLQLMPADEGGMAELVISGGDTQKRQFNKTSDGRATIGAQPRKTPVQDSIRSNRFLRHTPRISENSSVYDQQAESPSLPPEFPRGDGGETEVNVNNVKPAVKETEVYGAHSPSCSGIGSRCLMDSIFEKHILTHAAENLDVNWKDVWSKISEAWKWDLEYHTSHRADGTRYGCWTCTPLEPNEPKLYPLTIASAPVVLPVEYQWPPAAGLNPPPDPRPSAPIDCRKELPLDIIRDLFLTFEDSVGFYVLISGLIQVIVPGDFNLEWASSHLPHKYGGLKVCYIRQNMEPTMWPSSTEMANPASSSSSHTPTRSELSNILHHPPTSSAHGIHSLGINDFIEARPRHGYRSEKFSGRIGLKVLRDNQCYLLMSTHIITEAILVRSHRNSFFGRTHHRFKKLEDDWNEHVGIWAGNTKIGGIHKSFDTQAEIYPNGFKHDITLVKPGNPNAVRDIVSPENGMGWLNHRSWASLRQQTSTVKILGPYERHRTAKSMKCSHPSEVLVVGEGIFRNQTAAAGSKPLKDHDMATWKDLVSRALLYRVHPDFDPPNGYSGIALYADGVRHDGSEGPGIVGFQSFVQRSGHVQNFDMDGTALDKRLQLGRIAFYGAFEVPEELKRDYTVA